MKKTTFLLAFAICSFLSNAQDTPDNSWLTGTWRGPGFGGTFEEIWSAPDAKGVSMGMFRYYDAEDNIQFYEFWVLDETGMKLKHFDPGFVGWEEKDGFVDFKLVSAESNKVILKGLVYELTDAGTLKISLALKQGEEVKTHVFELTKVK